MKILKFGGTSVQCAENINKVIDIVTEEIKNEQLAVVVSALGGITNMLIEASRMAAMGDTGYTTMLMQIRTRHFETIDELANGADTESIKALVGNMLTEFEEILRGVYLVKELSPRTLDFTQSFGERISANIIAFTFNLRGIDTEYLDSRKVVITDQNFNHAKVIYSETNERIQKHFANNQKLQIIPGFIGGTIDNETTTLGRGGSDYSAAIFAAALEADQLEIWTDVDGMMTADPRVVNNAYIINSISYNEALELSHFGSKVLHPRTVVPALTKKIPIWIKNTFNPKVKGTLICEKTEKDTSMIRGISSIDEVSLITIQGPGLSGVVGMAGRIFQTISKAAINILLITQGSSEHSVTFAVDPADVEASKSLIEEEFDLELQLKLIEPVIVEQDLCIVAIVGENMKNRAGISARLFEAVGTNGINVVATAQGASELNISIVIEKKNKRKALNAIHERFFLSDLQVVNAFIVGTGVIGGTLLKQICEQKEILAQNNMIGVNVVGIGNMDGMLFNEDGIDLTNWSETVKSDGDEMDLGEFVKIMKEMNLRNSVFVDNTASPEPPSYYKEMLDANISVVTPNKIANAASYEQYRALHLSALKYGVHFNYETNVGAGLPIIGTLQDLISSGDQIIKIEAILSGSLNYIFSSISSEKSFFEAVKEAKELGYTEPDPRLDLNGMDVARKILILARETGHQFDIEDIDVQSCLEAETRNAETMDEFWEQLEKLDDPKFNEWREKAEREGKKLKYVASFENGVAKTGIIEVDENHPFYNIKGSDNIVSFKTTRYNNNPLIVIGPGAGAEVTAGGVFADMLRIVKH